jgi:hypothetical protein
LSPSCRRSNYGVALAALLVASVSAPGAAFADACPNAAIRAQQGSSSLPECRAWERVSPADKNGSGIYFQGGLMRTAPDGERTTFVSSASFAGGVSGAPIVSDYLAERDGTGWTTENITQPAASDPFGSQLAFRLSYRWFSRDLTRGVLLRNDHPDMDRNLWLHDLATGSDDRLSPASITPLDPFSQLNYAPAFADATDDGGHVVFESTGRLTPDAPVPDGGPRTYEWVDGEVRLVGVLPASEGGGPAATSMAGRGLSGGLGSNARTERVMSEDGSRIYFTVPTGPQGSGDIKSIPGEVYLREDGATTTHVSASQRTDCAGDPTCGGDGIPDPVADPDGPGLVRFETASTDGSVVFLQSCRKLTDDATGNCDPFAGPYREEIFRYDVESGELTDLTPESAFERRICTANCGVLGTSNDGDYVYFVDDRFDLGIAIYLWHGGTITEIGPAFSLRNENAYSYIEGPRSSRVSEDGRFVSWTHEDAGVERLYL